MNNNQLNREFQPAGFSCIQQVRDFREPGRDLLQFLMVGETAVEPGLEVGFLGREGFYVFLEPLKFPLLLVGQLPRPFPVGERSRTTAPKGAVVAPYASRPNRVNGSPGGPLGSYNCSLRLILSSGSPGYTSVGNRTLYQSFKRRHLRF